MPVSLWIHAVLLTLMMVLEITAVVFAIRRSKNWYKYHRRFAFWGALFGAVGVAELFIVKLIAGEAHFGPLHAKIGAVAILLLGAVVLAGANLAKLPPLFRPVHRTMGRVTVLLLLVVLIMGFMLIF